MLDLYLSVLWILNNGMYIDTKYQINLILSSHTLVDTRVDTSYNANWMH